MELSRDVKAVSSCLDIMLDVMSGHTKECEDESTAYWKSYNGLHTMQRSRSDAAWNVNLRRLDIQYYYSCCAHCSKDIGFGNHYGVYYFVASDR